MIRTDPRAGSGDGSLLIVLTASGLDNYIIEPKNKRVKQNVEYCCNVITLCYYILNSTRQRETIGQKLHEKPQNV